MKFRPWHRRRLQKLAKLLCTKKVINHFNLQGWASTSIENLTAKKIDCGTTACAVGWACTIPSFRKAGLRLESNYSMGPKGIGPYPVPHFKNEYGILAAANFFGLSLREASLLFIPGSYHWHKDRDKNGNVKITEVVKRINNLIKEKAKAQ